MSYSTWTNFAYYKVGDIVSYSNINYQALLANKNVVPTTLAPNWIVVPAAAVSSVNGLTGAPVIGSAADSTIDVATSSPNITIQLDTRAFGVYTEATGGAFSTIITSAICKTTSVVLVSYTHGGGAGAATQYITDIVSSTGDFKVNTNDAVAIGDQIHWLILNP